MSQILDESTSTREKSADPSLGEIVDDDSLTTMMVNSIVVDQGIVGTNSRLTDENQMSDPNLKRMKTIIQAKERSGNKIKINKNYLNIVRKKLLKHLLNLKIIKNLIYLVDDEKFGKKRQRYLIPRKKSKVYSAPI